MTTVSQECLELNYEGCEREGNGEKDICLNPLTRIIQKSNRILLADGALENEKKYFPTLKMVLLS